MDERKTDNPTLCERTLKSIPLAVSRTLMGADRTLMAWIRTVLVPLLGIGWQFF